MTKEEAESRVSFLKSMYRKKPEFCGSLVEVLENQIPVKPKTKKLITAIRNDGKETYELEIICPKCKEELFIDYSYCPKCGTKIDMSEVRNEVERC